MVAQEPTCKAYSQPIVETFVAEPMLGTAPDTLHSFSLVELVAQPAVFFVAGGFFFAPASQTACRLGGSGLSA
jgi:hypothetical protein